MLISPTLPEWGNCIICISKSSTHFWKACTFFSFMAIPFDFLRGGGWVEKFVDPHIWQKPHIWQDFLDKHTTKINFIFFRRPPYIFFCRPPQFFIYLFSILPPSGSQMEYPLCYQSLFETCWLWDYFSWMKGDIFQKESYDLDCQTKMFQTSAI